MKESFVSSQRISDAIRYFELRGYRHTDVPMVVPMDINDLTCPSGVELTAHGDGVYSGSAEQGFLYLLDQNLLREGKYMALTPCMRGDELDETHFRVFVKLELIHVLGQGYTVNEIASKTKLGELIGSVMNFVFEQSSRCKKPVKVSTIEVENCKSHIQYDIMLNDIEIGSYGLRHDSNGSLYMYGTGIAEPRFSYAMSLNK